MAYTYNKIVLLKGAFNYFNRRIYFYESLSNYIAAADDYETKTDISFNPNDGVTTELIVNLSDAVDYFEFTYLLVLDSLDGIVSRWYIIDAKRNLQGQFTLSLRRDVVAEALCCDEFINEAPIYVEKGILPNLDPMIVNDEGMRFNQIKQKEILLKDPAGWGYIVGYFEKGATTGTVNFKYGADFTPDNYLTQAEILSATGLDLSVWTDLVAGVQRPFAVSNLSLVYGVTFYNPLNQLSAIRKQQILLPNKGLGLGDLNNSSITVNEFAFAWSHQIGIIRAAAPYELTAITDYLNSQTVASLTSAINSVLQNDVATDIYLNKETFNKLLALEGNVVKIGNDYFQMHFETTGETAHNEVVISKGEHYLFDAAIAAAFSGESTQSNSWELYLNYKVNNVTMKLIPYAPDTLHTEIPATANSLYDAPYSMFIIPYCDSINLLANGNVPYDTDMMGKQQALNCAAALATALGDKLYDLQLLPYIPDFDNWLVKWGTPNAKWYVNLRNKTYDADYTDIKTAGNDAVGAILFMTISTFSYNLQYMLSHEDEPKIESQCNFYRLCSPNYNGLFEFNLAKNGGLSSFMEVSCTYKPISPFIRITPQFSFLYGSNYLDGRGLICGGDFSLPIISEAWIRYEQNNKNYANIFARDIQNLDVSQQQERFKEPFALGAGIIGSGVGGAVAGGTKGGVYGAIAGAVVGTAAGGVGAALDAKLAEQRRGEAKDYMIDRFNMNLANIKAIPNSLTRNSAFTITNKIFPFIEYYSCTDEEKEALRKKIIYDGMTVGRIDYLSNFMGGSNNQQFFKGQLIRSVGVYDNEDFIMALYNEIAKGVYI